MADAGVGESVAAEGAKSAGEATAVDAGAATAADAGSTAALADAGATAAGVGGATAADIGAGAGVAGGVDAATATLPAAADATAGAGTLADVTVTGAAEGAGGFGPSAALIPAAAGAVGPVGGGSPTQTAQPQPGQKFLQPTGEGSPTTLSPDLASQFGVGEVTLADTMPQTPFDTFAPSPDVGTPNIDPGSIPDATGGGGMGDSLAKWLKNPKNFATAGMLGISGMTALFPPALPGAAKTALGAAGPAVQAATSVIQSGGTATPIWTQQKATIDTSIDQSIKDETSAIQQAAANSGEGTTNSGIVQQQIAQIKQKWETQRQQLYLQAQQQNVSNAIAELTGANSVLSSIANMQMQQQEEARAAAGQTAELALLLQSRGG